MELKKHDIIKRIRTNNNPGCESANTESTFVVRRVNKKTYSVEVIGGYMVHAEFLLDKNFKEESVDEYGTVTKYVRYNPPRR